MLAKVEGLLRHETLILSRAIVELLGDMESRGLGEAELLATKG